MKKIIKKQLSKCFVAIVSLIIMIIPLLKYFENSGANTVFASTIFTKNTLADFTAGSYKYSQIDLSNAIPMIKKSILQILLSTIKT